MKPLWSRMLDFAQPLATRAVRVVRALPGGLIGVAALEALTAVFLATARGHNLVAATIGYGLECACALYLVIRLWTRDDINALVLIALTATAIRVPLLAGPPACSNDAYRYVWDGELLLRGIDPHAVTPLSPVAAPLRTTWLWPHIDYRTIPTVYPPLALDLFAVMALDSRNLWGAKIVALAGDALTIGMVLVTLGIRRMPRGRAAVYALHPLAALEFSGNAHIEGWAIAGIVFAAGTPTTGALSRFRPLSLAAAILTKIYPVIVAPIIFARNRLALATVVAIVAIVYAPELAHGHAAGSALNYVSVQHFNGSLGAVFGTKGEALTVAIVGIFAFLYARRGGDIALAVLVVVLAYLLSSPNVLPWYVLVLPAILCITERPFADPLRPLSLGIVGWSATVAMAYGAPSYWHEDRPLGFLMRGIEYAPVYAGLFLTVWQARRRLFASRISG